MKTIGRVFPNKKKNSPAKNAASGGAAPGTKAPSNVTTGEPSKEEK